MTVSAPERKASSPAPRPARRRWIALGMSVAAVGVAALVIGFGARLLHPHEGRALPNFPSLAEHPDAALHGTVAYYANDTGCIRLVAAAGRPSKDVYCISQKDLAVRPQQGVKPAGPQLVWRADGRLEVTMFLWSPVKGQPPDYRPGWQKLIDVRSGRVETVPAARVPDAPNTGTQPTVSNDGQRVAYSLDASTGRAKVTLTDTKGTRTLLSVHGPGEYTYRFGPAFWAPNWQWIAASDDGRILIITPGNPSRTRVLVTNSGGGAGGGSAGPAFAITSADLLTTSR